MSRATVTNRVSTPERIKGVTGPLLADVRRHLPVALIEESS